MKVSFTPQLHQDTIIPFQGGSLKPNFTPQHLIPPSQEGVPKHRYFCQKAQPRHQNREGVPQYTQSQDPPVHQPRHYFLTHYQTQQSFRPIFLQIRTQILTPICLQIPPQISTPINHQNPVRIEWTV